MATTTPTTDKYLNILLFDEKHAAERNFNDSIFYFSSNFRRNGGREWLEDNLNDSVEVLLSTLPLKQLLPPDWDGRKSNQRIMSLEGEIYPAGYTLNDGKIIYSAFWDYYATPALIALPNKFASFREWWVSIVLEWLDARRITYVRSSDEPDVYLEKIRATIPVAIASTSQTGISETIIL